MPEIGLADLRSITESCGLALHGVAEVEPLREDAARLAAWQAHGYAGEMRYMERSPELLSDPRRLLPNARSVIVLGVRYGASAPPECPVGYGRVARYAWGVDYHTVLRERLHRLVEELSARFGEGVHARVFSDSVPLLERALAAQAGLGFIGKNTLLIVPREGSFLFLAEVLSNLVVRCNALPVVETNCGGCFRCGERCPTGAIVEPYRLDARRCISYLTIEKRSMLSRDERAAIGAWVFGCDICQDVCPFNHRAIKTNQPPDIPDFAPEGGVGPLLDLSGVLGLTSEGEFRRRFGRTALARARRKTLVRNAALVAANTGAVGLTGRVAELVISDPSPLVRSHSLWAVWTLERRYHAGVVDLPTLLNRVANDPSPEVRREREDIEEGLI